MKTTDCRLKATDFDILAKSTLPLQDAEREANMVELALLCDSMDVNGNGSLSLQEMLDGYDHNHHFNNLMQEMDFWQNHEHSQGIFLNILSE